MAFLCLPRWSSSWKALSWGQMERWEPALYLVGAQGLCMSSGKVDSKMCFN